MPRPETTSPLFSHGERGPGDHSSPAHLQLRWSQLGEALESVFSHLGGRNLDIPTTTSCPQGRTSHGADTALGGDAAIPILWVEQQRPIETLPQLFNWSEEKGILLPNSKIHALCPTSSGLGKFKGLYTSAKKLLAESCSQQFSRGRLVHLPTSNNQ